MWSFYQDSAYFQVVGKCNRIIKQLVRSPGWNKFRCLMRYDKNFCVLKCIPSVNRRIFTILNWMQHHFLLREALCESWKRRVFALVEVSLNVNLSVRLCYYRKYKIPSTFCWVWRVYICMLVLEKYEIRFKTRCEGNFRLVWQIVIPGI